jgi:hypothetical protein
MSPHPRKKTGLPAAVLAALVLAVAASSPSAARRERSGENAFYHAYRADEVEPVAGGVPRSVRALPERGAAPWPDDLREPFERQIRREWGAGRVYGPVRAGIGMWLVYPMLTARVSDRVVVPVVTRDTIPVRGVLSLPAAGGPRRVVLLVDASSSANAPTLFRGDSGAGERIPILEAEWRAVDRLLDSLDTDRVELGVIAFGETTRPIVAPGATVPAVRASLERFRSENPKGDGRTDLVCALWTARDWLDEAPPGYGREIVLLSDGDLPHSGRFLECEGAGRRRDEATVAACEARRNLTPCPASHEFRRSDGTSDLVQLYAFARRSRKALNAHTLVFEENRPARPYRELSASTGGDLVRVPSAASIEAALPALVARKIRGVFARNATNGIETGDLYDAKTRSFDGRLSLAPGGNDVEIRVESDTGVAALYRYRIYSEPGRLESYLSGLRERNLELEARIGELSEKQRQTVETLRREIEIRTDPAAPAD